MRDRGGRLPLGFEVVRAVILITLVLLAVYVALPVLLQLAAVPFH
jgi:hypothetical protein